MSRILSPLALFASLALITACGTDVGTDGVIVGGACTVSSDCSIDSACRTDSDDFPNGYCASSCASDEECPEGSQCTDDDDLCLDSCAGDGDCREGYTCQEVEARGRGGTAMVCLGAPS